MKKPYILEEVIQHLQKLGLGVNNSNLYIVNLHYGKMPIGNKVWGKLDFLCNYHGYRIQDRAAYSASMQEKRFWPHEVSFENWLQSRN